VITQKLNFPTSQQFVNGIKQAFSEYNIEFDDNLAFGVYKSVQQNKLNIPEDISVIGFDDNLLSSFSWPPLTTVRLPKEKMVEYHLSILSAVLLQERKEINIYSAEPMLIQRGSVKNLMK